MKSVSYTDLIYDCIKTTKNKFSTESLSTLNNDGCCCTHLMLHSTVLESSINHSV